MLTGSLDPSDYAGRIRDDLHGDHRSRFKKSLLVVVDRRDSVVQIRSVVMIALLAICRKIIIIDLTETDALHTLAFAVAILVLGVVYWLLPAPDQRVDEASEFARWR